MATAKKKYEKTFEATYKKGTYPDVAGVNTIRELFKTNISPQDIEILATAIYNDGERESITLKLTYTPSELNKEK